jgi:hypothetical protein
MNQRRLLTLLAGAALLASHLSAQVPPQQINYQGRVVVGGVNFNGPGQFKFALVGPGGTPSFWSNNSTSVNGSEPTVAVSLTVANGLYSVALGDTTLAGMTAPIPASVFDNADVRLRVWFNDGVNGSQLLTPDQRITSVGYAMMSANVRDGAITGAKLAAGAITADKLAPGAVDSASLGNDLDLGDAGTLGRLDVYRTSAGTAAITLNGSDSRISTYGSDGLEQIRLYGASWGELWLNNSLENNARAVTLSANGGSGGYLWLNNSNGSSRVRLSGANSGGLLTLYQADGGTGAILDGEDTGSGSLGLYNTNGVRKFYVKGQSTGSAAELSMFGSGSSETIQLLGAESSNEGAEIRLRNNEGGNTLEIDGDWGSSAGGAIVFYTSNGVSSVRIEASDSGGNGRVTTQVLQITGGADLSENFDIQPLDADVQPGMIVSIDPEQPGHLLTSTRAYDKTVAGIVSGAGGVKTGMLMGQAGSVADGQHPVALTGRVYCWVDAAHGAVKPGDLITTSDTPGHGMKVSDHAQAQGAIIGKAMSPLASGKGLVLVLVSLQ